MYTPLNKAALNKELIKFIKLLSTNVIIKCGLIGAKWVEVKESRVCHNCKCEIPKNAIALTSSYRVSRNMNRRMHNCYSCAGLMFSNAISETKFLDSYEKVRDEEDIFITMEDEF